jgi:multicomponent Na+:H+ antiporter subunit C
MSATLPYAAAGVLLFVLGLFGLFARRRALTRVVAANVAASGVFLVLVAAPGAVPPDPVPQALVLTGIVIAVAVTAYAAALLRRLADAGADEPP